MKISCVILAAGNSTRFKDNKLLCQMNGLPMILHLFEKVKDIDFHQVCVVTQYKQIEEYANTYGYDVVMNQYPFLGISHSIQLGVKRCYESDYIMFIVSDMPFLKKETLLHLIAHIDGNIIACTHNGILVNPMLFPKHYYHELMTLKGDKGGQSIALLHTVTKVNIDRFECQDIDTQDDLIKYQ